MSAPVLIVGAGLAGWTVATTLREEGYAGELVVLGDEPHPPYDRPPLSKGALRRTTALDALTLPGADRAAELGIDLRLAHRVVACDPATRTITLADGTALAYGELVIATGVRPRTLPGALTVRHRDDLAALWALPPDAAIAIVGAGFLGSELAATLRELGHPVTLVTGSGAPLADQLGPEIATVLARWHTAHGVTLRHGRVTSVAELAADTVLACLGSEPNTEWLTGSGLPLADGVLTDADGRAGAHEWAVGDVAREPAGRIEHRMAASTAGVRLGVRLAALLADREPPAPLAAVPYHWTDHYGATVQAYGHVAGDLERQVVAGSVDEDRVAVLCGRDGIVVGAVGIGLPRALVRAAKLIRDGAGYDPDAFAASLRTAAAAGPARPR
ncbi:FAD-dependent oxidoreductase [Enemella evansiae]|uniref:FAD-dependent oxidoreductase n=1 Tax=Enemella evansiae TaxID=2016499 RepID=A0A255GAS7_9ACTN|nr:FAD-dependent oxidoreductase [Enemella evansiae]OYO12945.1 FAD-dependent oxidoreductase [Enemella evansiae]